MTDAFCSCCCARASSLAQSVRAWFTFRVVLSNSVQKCRHCCAVDGAGLLWTPNGSPRPMAREDSQLELEDVHHRYWPGYQDGLLDAHFVPVRRYACPSRLTYPHQMPSVTRRRERPLRGRAGDPVADNPQDDAGDGMTACVRRLFRCTPEWLGAQSDVGALTTG
jgi:hypothetical protein